MNIKEDWETEIKRICASYTLEPIDLNEALEDHLISYVKDILPTQEEKIIEHIIKCIETDPEIKIPRSYDASWILTNLQFHKKVGEHQSPWFSKDNNL